MFFRIGCRHQIGICMHIKEFRPTYGRNPQVIFTYCSSSLLFYTQVTPDIHWSHGWWRPWQHQQHRPSMPTICPMRSLATSSSAVLVSSNQGFDVWTSPVAHCCTHQRKHAKYSLHPPCYIISASVTAWLDFLTQALLLVMLHYSHPLLTLTQLELSMLQLFKFDAG